MLVKFMLLFLIAMAVLAMFGKLRLRKTGAPLTKCKSCGKPLIGPAAKCGCKDQRG